MIVRQPRMDRYVTAMATATLMAVALGAAPGAWAGEEPSVEIERIDPPVVGLPEGLETIAFIPFTQAIEDRQHVYTSREKKWGDYAIGAVSSRMQEGCREFDLPLRLVDRDAVVSIMKEKDLADAGLAEPNKALELGKLAHAQAICYGRMTIGIETVEGQSKTLSLAHDGYRFRPVAVDKKHIKRTISVGANIKLVGVVTGQTIYSFSESRNLTVDVKPKMIMGADADATQLQPEDEAIGQMIDELVDKFVGQLVPHHVRYKVRLAKPKEKMAKSAMKMLQVGETDGAIDLFRQSLDVHGKDHAAMYDLGVAYECKGLLDQAQEAYRKAYAMNDKELYLEGVKRVAEQIKKVSPLPPTTQTSQP